MKILNLVKFLGMVVAFSFIGSLLETVPIIKDLGNWIFASGFISGIVFLYMASDEKL